MSSKTLSLSYSSILMFALPMMVSGFIQSVVLITDSAFISRYSVIGFDAVGNAGLAYVTFFIMLMGMSDGAQIIMARRIGQEQFSAVGQQVTAAGLVLIGLAAFFFTLLQTVVPTIIQGNALSAEVAELQGVYLKYRSFGLFFAMITLLLQALYLAQGRTRLVLSAALITAGGNIVLDYLFIYGIGVFPELGVAGAGLASALADALGMSFLLAVTLVSRMNRPYELFQKKRNISAEVKALLKVGTPLMLQGFFALFTWTIFFVWIEQMGQFELTVSQNIRSLYFLAFVPIWGFASTTKTYISQYIGAGQQESIPLIQRRIQRLTLIFLLIFFHGAIIYPRALISIINPHQEFLAESSAILQLIIGSILIFGIVSVYFQTILGSGNTVASMTIEIVSVTIYMVFAYLFIKVFKFDIYYVWTVEYIYFGTMGALSLLYLYFFNWKQKKI
ncbi:MAG: MATE family efflux transporter [Bacteroidetes bacterium]|nr:MATE family efflux transporter [Bacteroidota bacterium]MBM3424192.1 MATE family efflux transporter [Bacteroidota bacterium]